MLVDYCAALMSVQVFITCMQLKNAIGAEWEACKAADVQFRGRISNMWRLATGRPELAEDRDNCPGEAYEDEISDEDAQGGSDRGLQGRQ